MKEYNNIKEFYPTPNTLLDKVLGEIDFNHVDTVLEPSAGKGDIVDWIDRKVKRGGYYRSTIDIDCVEIDPTLRATLKGKEYRVVHDDFLTFNTYKRYDLIVMNPPFSCGAKHLLKAIEMQRRGGAIVCILNAETIKNPYTNERKELLDKLDKYNATIEYMEQEFITAEHKTDVEIAIVKINIEHEEMESTFYNFYKKLKTKQYGIDTEAKLTELADADFLKAIVLQYEIELEAGIRLIREHKAMQKYILHDVKADAYSHSNLELKMGSGGNATINNFVKETRAKYWRALFSNPKFTGKMTSKMQSDYSSQISRLRDYDFSLYNIGQIQLELVSKVKDGIEECIISLFDELTHEHAYYDGGKNIHYYNGWKTNKAYIINDKVIMPWSYHMKWRYTSFTEMDITNWDNIGKLSDVEKALNYLDCGRTEEVDLTEKLKSAHNAGISRNIHLKYFDVTFYKKGTVHIVFTNKELLKKLNIYGSQKKGWLPCDYGKKQYNEMTQEEKDVIDSFEGKESYNKVMSNPKYYIVNSNDFLIEDKTVA